MKTLSKLTSLVLVSAGLIAAPVAMAQPASGKTATKAGHVHKKANKTKKQANDLKQDKAAEAATTEATSADAEVKAMGEQGQAATQTAPAADLEQAPANQTPAAK
ncbi:late embryogeneis abundant protein [Neisseria mucosa]|uniref:late embryogeneis abundant protein n=1 Tax=Neisseria mucosa TaxID=488 RepID=UPI000D38E87C|nr:late embryogeneis abundant protein [Neisseria mucosa]